MSNENVSLPVAEALASALAKIEAYVPTEYVDNSEPDIDAEHLNHAEQGIMRVTNLLNAAVDVIQGQESRLSDAETKVGTAALTGGMTDLSSGLNKLNSDLTLKANGYIVMSNLDLNSIEFGIYLVTNAVNAPDANWWMILSAVKNGTGSQIAKSVTSKTIMTRELAAGNWSSWYSLHS